jgi:hypothetical protein
MGVLSKGTDFTNGDQITDTSLDNLVDNATFTTSAVDEVSTDIGGTGAIIVKDEGITTGKLANSTGAGDGVTTAKLATAAVTAAKLGTDAVTTVKILDANVTTAKIADANVTTAKILDANVTTAKIADANVTFAKLTDVIDDDTMTTATATNLATSESIKAYVDSSAAVFVPATYAGEESVTLPNGLITKMGIVTAITSGTSVSFGAAFPSGVVSALACPNSGAALTQSSGFSGKAAVDSLTTSGMNVSCDGSAYWQAFGY